MNNRVMVKLSNAIGIISIAALLYWIFIFTLITVFELRVFREGTTETFYLSILGILALMAGTLMINIMLNLTRIAEKQAKSNDEENEKGNRHKKWGWIAFILSFPLIFVLLFTGNYLNTQKKEDFLIKSAQSIIASNPSQIDRLLDYRFEESWILEAGKALAAYEKLDKHFPGIEIIVQDKMDDMPVFLGFQRYYLITDDEVDTKKTKKWVRHEFIRSTTHEEREYLKTVFDQGKTDVRFSASKGKYELFYPYTKDGKTILFYFSEHSRYGKFGS